MRSTILPPIIEEKLTKLGLRIKLLALLKGLSLTCVVYLVLVSAGFAIDRFLVVPYWVRGALLFVTIVGTLCSALIFIAIPLVRHYDGRALAFALESAHPELQERLVSTIQLLQSPEPDEIKGSPELIAVLTEQTEAVCSAIDHASAAPLKRIRRAVTTASVMLACFALYAALKTAEFKTLFRRLMFLADIPRPSKTKLLVSPNQRSLAIAEGKSLTIVARATGVVPRNAFLLYYPQSGEKEVLPMLSGNDGNFALTLGNLRRSFSFRVRAGDAVSSLTTVKVLPTPRPVEFSFHYKYPQYMSLPARSERRQDGNIVVPQGTEVTLKVTSSQPLTSARFVPKGSRPRAMEVLSEKLAQVTFSPRYDDAYNIEMTNTDKLKGISGPYTIGVLPDRPPSIEILRPAPLYKTSPDYPVKVEMVITDDFLVASARVAYRINSGDELSVPIDLIPPHSKTTRAEYTFELPRMNLKFGDRIQWFVSASDGRQTEGGTAQTQNFTIIIAPGLQRSSPIARAVEQLKKLAKETTPDNIKSRREKLKEELRSIARELRKAEPQHPLDRSDSRILARASESIARKLDSQDDREALEQLERTAQAGEKLAQSRKAQQIPHRAGELADAERELARDLALNPPADRIDSAKATSRQSSARDSLNRMLDDLKSLTALPNESAKATSELEKARKPLNEAYESSIKEDWASVLEKAREASEQLAQAQPELQKLAEAGAELAREAREALRELAQPLSKQAEHLAQAQKQASAQPEEQTEREIARRANQLAEAVRAERNPEIPPADAQLTRAQAELVRATDSASRSADAQRRGKDEESRRSARQSAENLQRAADALRSAEDAQRLADSAEALEQLADQLTQNSVNPELRDLRRASQQAREVADAFEQASEANPTISQNLRPAGEELRQLAEQIASTPQQRANDIARQVSERLNELASKLRRASEELAPAQSNLPEVARLAEELARAQNELARRARQSAERAGEGSPETRRQLGELAREQAQLARQADRLRNHLEDLAQQNPGNSTPFERASEMVEHAEQTMAEASRAMAQAQAEPSSEGRTNSAQRAQEQSRQAGSQLEETARALRNLAQAEALRDSARQQASIEAGTANINPDDRQSAEALARAQGALANQVSRLEPRSVTQPVSNAMRRATEELKAQQPHRAVPLQRQAREALESTANQLAQQAQDALGAEPSPSESLARMADQQARLAQLEAEPSAELPAQQQLLEQARSMLASSPQALGELSARAQALAQQASDVAGRQAQLQQQFASHPQPSGEALQRASEIQEQLAREAELIAELANRLANDSAPVSPQLAQSARQAAQSARQASQSAREASESARRQNTQSAASQSAQSALQMAQASARLREAGQSLASSTQPSPPDSGSEPDSSPGQDTGGGRPIPPSSAGQLSEAVSAMQEAVNALKQGSPEASKAQARAASALARAANLAHKANIQARTVLEGQGNMSIVRATPVPDTSPRMDKEDWGKLPGELRNKILQALQEPYPPELEPIIREYFRKLAETEEEPQQ